MNQPKKHKINNEEIFICSHCRKETDHLYGYMINEKPLRYKWLCRNCLDLYYSFQENQSIEDFYEEEKENRFK